VAQAFRPALPRFVGAFFFAAVSAFAQLPSGPGKADVEKLCAQCHEIERSVSLRQDRTAWQSTVDKMAGLGMKATSAEITAAVDYLAAHYPASEMPPLDINQARAIEFESTLSLPRSQAAAIIQYRTKNGPFKTIDDLKKVPGVDAAKVEAHRSRMVCK
jgi:competence protein ComEA